MLRRSCANDFSERRDADTHQFAARALFSLFLAQILITNHVHCFLERGLIVAAIVLPAERRFIRELFWLDEVLHAEFGRIHTDLVREHVRSEEHTSELQSLAYL